MYTKRSAGQRGTRKCLSAAMVAVLTLVMLMGAASVSAEGGGFASGRARQEAEQEAARVAQAAAAAAAKAAELKKRREAAYAASPQGQAEQALRTYKNRLPAALMSATSALSSDGGLVQAIVESGAAVRAEILKAATAKNAYVSGKEAYVQEQILNKEAADIKEKLRQPTTNEQTTNTQQALYSGKADANSKVFQAQKLILQPLENNSNTTAAMDSAHQVTNLRFCSDDEVTRRVCVPTTDPKYTNFAGADQDAMFLFQTSDGHSTYEGDRDGAQVEAANSYIKRVVVGTPPEQLRKAVYAKTPQGRAYVESLRRYRSFLSMSAFSLNNIKENRNPLK